MLGLIVAATLGQYADYYPRELLPYENSVCRIIVNDGGGVASYGSGVLLKSPESHKYQEYVLTAYHVIRDRQGEIRVTWDGRQFFGATVAAARPACDSAVLAVDDVPRHLPRIEIAQEEIRPGEAAFAFGFGDTRSVLRCSGGPVIQLTMNSHSDGVWFDLTASVRQGDSGGPVFVVRDGKPQVIGNLWGCVYDSSRRHYIASCNRLRVLRRLFGAEKHVANSGPVTRGYNQVNL